MKLKKLGLLALAGALGLMLAVGCAKEEAPNEDTNANQQEQIKADADSVKSGYAIERMELEIEQGGSDSKVYYPKMSNYKGELTQDYINQSLENAVKMYADKGSYSSAQIDYDIKRMDSDVLSIVFKGTAEPRGLGREVNIMQSVNIDVATSNEITYENLVKDDESMRKVLAKKLKESKNMEFEAEGIRVYFDNGSIVFFYMPLDDSAEEFIQIEVTEGEIEDILNKDFGEHPAS